MSSSAALGGGASSARWPGRLRRAAQRESPSDAPRRRWRQSPELAGTRRLTLAAAAARRAGWSGAPGRAGGASPGRAEGAPRGARTGGNPPRPGLAHPPPRHNTRASEGARGGRGSPGSPGGCAARAARTTAASPGVSQRGAHLSHYPPPGRHSTPPPARPSARPASRPRSLHHRTRIQRWLLLTRSPCWWWRRRRRRPLSPPCSLRAPKSFFREGEAALAAPRSLSRGKEATPRQGAISWRPVPGQGKFSALPPWPLLPPPLLLGDFAAAAAAAAPSGCSSRPLGWRRPRGGRRS